MKSPQNDLRINIVAFFVKNFIVKYRYSILYKIGCCLFTPANLSFNSQQPLFYLPKNSFFAESAKTGKLWVL